MIIFSKHAAAWFEKNLHEKKILYAHDRDRTCDRWLIRPMLYQLSYTSLPCDTNVRRKYFPLRIAYIPA